MDPYHDASFDRYRLGSIQNLSFRPISSKEVNRLSAVKITTPLTFDSLGQPLPGSLYDPRMGPIDSKLGNCPTCGNFLNKCLGHFGHIELPLPVINPIYQSVLLSILKMSCMACGKILLHPVAKEIFIAQVKLLQQGCLSDALDIADKFEFLPTSWARVEENILLEVKTIDWLHTFVESCVSKKTVIGDRIEEVRGDGKYKSLFYKKACMHEYHLKICPFCFKPWKTFVVMNGKMYEHKSKVDVASKFQNNVDEETEDTEKNETPEHTFFMPSEVLKHFQRIWNEDKYFLMAVLPILNYSQEEYPTNIFFMNELLVPPTNTRPVNFEDGMYIEHPQNSFYIAILNSCLILRSLIHILNVGESHGLSDERMQLVSSLQGNSNTEKLTFAWQELQSKVNAILDSRSLKKKGAFVASGLKQIIEKKEGIVRMNIMGKRVNYAARSVITPDPIINIDEIGIPEVFAKKLTYPVPITEWNVEEMRKRVINGPSKHPGANFIQNEDGSIVKLNDQDKSQREAVAKRLLTLTNQNGIKILHRHLVNGDILLLNRQPTLHRPSIMAHKARILKGEKTFRLHYANCKSYNADFDGDEMNAHFPQNEVARSEAYNLVGVPYQYLVPKDGSPLSGLIQDHVIAGVKMTVRGKFFNKSDYMNLVYQALSSKLGRIKILPPAIIKPVPLWSGKQIISTVLLNIIPKGNALINLKSTSKISAKAWEKMSPDSYHWKVGGTPFTNSLTMSESSVIIRQGQLLTGVLDKTHYGSTAYSLVHCVYELYGGDISIQLLSSFSKLFTAFLQIEGFTLGVKDILVLKPANRQRFRLMREARSIGNSVTAKALGITEDQLTSRALEAARFRIPNCKSLLDREYKLALDKFTNEINKTCLITGLLTPFPQNNLQLMVLSGAKGSTVNTMQISCLLGQIELEGKRPPLMISGKSLPSFLPYETSPRSGGFVDGRFMTGIKPQEFFFHCMAGREGLIDTACKTSRSGYLQRCLVKHLEGLSIGYDLTVRDSDGSVIQFLYGEDGLDVCKSQFLQDSTMEFLSENLSAITSNTTPDSVSAEVKSFKKKLKKYDKGERQQSLRQTGFTLFSSFYKDPISNEPLICGRTPHAIEVCRKWYNLSPEEKSFHMKRTKRINETVTSLFKPDRYVGSMSEKFERIIERYIENLDDKEEIKNFRNTLYDKHLQSCAVPGEPVGLLAAQSVGEPSTQMTLNTFHFAGRGEMNVTLGIPRLRELLMVASKCIKTPSMEVPLRNDLPNVQITAEKLRKELNCVFLADVLESITVTERIEYAQHKQIYFVRMNFLPKKAIKEISLLSLKSLLRCVEKKFLGKLVEIVAIKIKNAIKSIIVESEKLFKNADHDEDEEGEPKSPRKGNRSMGTGDDYASSEDEPEGQDDDATTSRRRQRQNEEQQYSDIEDMEDEEIIRELEQEEKEGQYEEEEEEDISESQKNVDKQEDQEVEGAVGSGKTKKSVVSAIHEIIDYRYDPVKYSWCEFTLKYNVTKRMVDFYSILKDLANLFIVSQVPGIKKGYVSKNRDGNTILKTEGINFEWVFKKCNLLQVENLYCNDIHAVAMKYGIEAAAKVLVREVENVFKVYGIGVDKRHLTLIADYMTFIGQYTPLNRKGMESSVSPMQQMSFESCLITVKNSLYNGRTDSTKNPSACLFVGKPIKIGTGSFDLKQDLNAVWC